MQENASGATYRDTAQLCAELLTAANASNMAITLIKVISDCHTRNVRLRAAILIAIPTVPNDM